MSWGESSCHYYCNCCSNKDISPRTCNSNCKYYVLTDRKWNTEIKRLTKAQKRILDRHKIEEHNETP